MAKPFIASASADFAWLCDEIGRQMDASLHEPPFGIADAWIEALHKKAAEHGYVDEAAKPIWRLLHWDLPKQDPSSRAEVRLNCWVSWHGPGELGSLVKLRSADWIADDDRWQTAADSIREALRQWASLHRQRPETPDQRTESMNRTEVGDIVGWYSQKTFDNKKLPHVATVKQWLELLKPHKRAAEKLRIFSQG